MFSGYFITSDYFNSIYFWPFLIRTIANKSNIRKLRILDLGGSKTSAVKLNMEPKFTGLSISIKQTPPVRNERNGNANIKFEILSRNFSYDPINLYVPI